MVALSQSLHWKNWCAWNWPHKSKQNVIVLIYCRSYTNIQPTYMNTFFLPWQSKYKRNSQSVRNIINQFLSGSVESSFLWYFQLPQLFNNKEVKMRSIKLFWFESYFQRPLSFLRVIVKRFVAFFLLLHIHWNQLHDNWCLLPARENNNLTVY